MSLEVEAAVEELRSGCGRPVENRPRPARRVYPSPRMAPRTPRLRRLVSPWRGSLGALLAALLAVGGCGGSPVGEPCELTSGALGFGFDDPCASKCLQLSTVTCADGSTARQAVCAGRRGCDPGGCPAGQVCYSFEDPFEVEDFCIPAQICGTPPASSAEALAWERASRERAEALREKFRQRMERREGAVTAPAEKPQPTSG